MNSFEELLGKNISDIPLNDSFSFFIAPLEYYTKHCGKRYPASKFKSYVKFIETLDKQGKLSGKKEVVRELTKIIYNSQSDNTGMLMNLIL